MTDQQSLSNLQLSRETDRLVLETLTSENMSDDYVDWLQDPEVIKYLEIRHSPQTKDTVYSFVNSMLDSDVNLLMGIFEKETSKHIGNIKVGPVIWRYGRADIGIIIGDKASWGKGYATEAIEGVCEVARKNLSLRKLQAGAYAGNQGSVKAFLKAGFEQEGVFKDYWLLDGAPEDDIYLGKVL